MQMVKRGINLCNKYRDIYNESIGVPLTNQPTDRPTGHGEVSPSIIKRNRNVQVSSIFQKYYEYE